ncbi:unnamed protein product [Taenia asiatica]|uniref:Sm domain-containing protein n=1 Tax=Taenia asiatica TaxID=60517 RepID=A0A0R3VUW6_TAEAS|nr:unnamed protein product [Taenia asiatica]
MAVAAEGNKKEEKEQHQTEPEEEQQEEGQQQQQQQRHPSSPSPSSSLPPPLAAAAASAAGAAKSSQREGDSRAGKDETESISAKTASAPATPSGVPWLAEKAIVLVRFSECFRRGRVIRYDAELNMCVVQLDFTNTVVNKGIEDIFPDDPSIIAAATAAEALRREQKTPPASSTRPSGFVSSDVPCPSSAPPFMSRGEDRYLTVAEVDVTATDAVADPRWRCTAWVEILLKADCITTIIQTAATSKKNGVCIHVKAEKLSVVVIEI